MNEMDERALNILRELAEVDEVVVPMVEDLILKARKHIDDTFKRDIREWMHQEHETLAERIVAIIWRDIDNRKGMHLDTIDISPEVQQEILEEQIAKVEKEIKKAMDTGSKEPNPERT